MKPISILQAMSDLALFGPFFNGKSWEPWKAMLAGLFGLPMAAEQAVTWGKHTGRTAVPASAFNEGWLICGRRSGKSRISAFVATYLATFVNWQPYLAAGEVGVVMLLASDRRQAQVLRNYIDGFFESISMLKKMIVNRTSDVISLDNGTVVSQRYANKINWLSETG